VGLNCTLRIKKNTKAKNYEFEKKEYLSAEVPSKCWFYLFGSLSGDR
jgi:hypothetical protein